MKSVPVQRSYESPLREEQAAATRHRILDGLSALLAEQDADDISMADVAQQAGVAERTLYRHFPTRLDLFRALFQQLVGEPDGPEDLRPESVEAIIDIVRTRFPRYAAQPRVLRQLNTFRSREDVRDRMAPARRAATASATADLVAGLTPKQRRQVQGVIQLLSSSDAFLHLNGYWKLDGDQAAEAVAWAIRTLADSVRERGMA